MNNEKNNEDTIFELRAIKRTLNIAFSETIDKYLKEVISSENRRQMWIAIDGKRMPNEIAVIVGVSTMAVSLFLKTAIETNIIKYEKGNPPMKIIDHVPSDWINKTDE